MPLLAELLFLFRVKTAVTKTVFSECVSTLRRNHDA